MCWLKGVFYTCVHVWFFPSETFASISSPIGRLHNLSVLLYSDRWLPFEKIRSASDIQEGWLVGKCTLSSHNPPHPQYTIIHNIILAGNSLTITRLLTLTGTGQLIPSGIVPYFTIFQARESMKRYHLEHVYRMQAMIIHIHLTHSCLVVCPVLLSLLLYFQDRKN